MMIAPASCGLASKISGLRMYFDICSHATQTMLQDPSAISVGCIPFFWSEGSATSPSIKDFGPTIVSDAAIDGQQCVGPAFDQRRLSLLIPKMGRIPSANRSFRSLKLRV